MVRIGGAVLLADAHREKTRTRARSLTVLQKTYHPAPVQGCLKLFVFALAYQNQNYQISLRHQTCVAPNQQSETFRFQTCRVAAFGTNFRDSQEDFCKTTKHMGGYGP